MQRRSPVVLAVGAGLVSAVLGMGVYLPYYSQASIDARARRNRQRVGNENPEDDPFFKQDPKRSNAVRKNLAELKEVKKRQAIRKAEMEAEKAEWARKIKERRENEQKTVG